MTPVQINFYLFREFIRQQFAIVRQAAAAEPRSEILQFAALQALDQHKRMLPIPMRYLQST